MAEENKQVGPANLKDGWAGPTQNALGTRTHTVKQQCKVTVTMLAQSADYCAVS